MMRSSGGLAHNPGEQLHVRVLRFLSHRRLHAYDQENADVQLLSLDYTQAAR